MAKVTKELQDLVRKNTKIKEVYFDKDDNHFFSMHQIEVHETDGDGYSKKVTKVDALPGVKKEAVKIITDPKRGKVIDKMVNTEYVPVHSKMSREQILKATPALRSMSDTEKLDILAKASAIAKEEGFQELLKTLKA